jgi:hypothetical protein
VNIDGFDVKVVGASQTLTYNVEDVYCVTIVDEHGTIRLLDENLELIRDIDLTKKLKLEITLK